MTTAHTIRAIDLCNCCDIDAAVPGNPAGYCESCDAAARDGRMCDHDSEG